MSEIRPVYMCEDTEGCVRETFAKFSDAKTWFDQHWFDNGVSATFEKCPISAHTLIKDYSKPKNKLIGRILTIQPRMSAFATSEAW